MVNSIELEKEYKQINQQIEAKKQEIIELESRSVDLYGLIHAHDYSCGFCNKSNMTWPELSKHNKEEHKTRIQINGILRKINSVLNGY